MEKSTAVQDFPLITDLPSRTLLISNVMPGASFKRSTDFFEDLKTLIGYRKRCTSTKIDYVQTDLCKFKTYQNYLLYLDRIDQRRSVVINWMLYAIPYNHPAAIPVGILLIYVILFIVQVFSKYATLFQTKGTQQTDLAIQKDSSPTESVTEGGQSSDEFLQPNRTGTPQPTVSGGDSALNINAKATNDNNIRLTGTDIPSTQNKNSKEHFCVQLSQNSDGPTTGSSERRHLSLDRGNSKCHGLYEGSQSGTNPERQQPSTNRGTFEAAACQPDKN